MSLLESPALELYTRAPLKAILSGEHSVVYGYPCIAMALNLYTSGRARIIRDAKYPSSFPFPVLLDKETGERLDLSSSMGEAVRLVNEEILIRLTTTEQSGKACYYCESVEITVHKWALGKGLGSSASILVSHAALLLAASSIYSLSLLFDVSLLGENYIHGQTTGMDLKTVIYGGIQVYSHKTLCNSRIPSDILLAHGIQILIADSDITKSTAQAVKLVRQRQNDNTLAQIGSVSESLIELLSSTSSASKASDEDFRLALSSIIQQNHALLCSLGVSVPQIERSREALYHMGCFAAKLTGAGLGGCCLGLRRQGDSTMTGSNMRILEVSVGERLIVTKMPCQV